MDKSLPRSLILGGFFMRFVAIGTTKALGEMGILRDSFSRAFVVYGGFSPLELADPDIAEADRLAGITVALQDDRAGAMLFHLRETDPLGRA